MMHTVPALAIYKQHDINSTLYLGMWVSRWGCWGCRSGYLGLWVRILHDMACRHETHDACS